MSKKTTIQITFISLCLLGSAYVLYNGFFNSEQGPEEQTSAGGVSVQSSSGGEILPHGDKFNIQIFEKTKMQFNQVNYPSLNFSQDVGINQRDLILPLESNK